MRILVTGIGGQLGHDVCHELDLRGIEHLGTGSKDMDITDLGAVRRTIGQYRPDAVIHCAAYTKVDRAEDEPDICWAVNAEGTRNIAYACRETGAKLLYVSTDYVFSGQGEAPYETDGEVAPLNVYGASKLSGEAAVKEYLERYFIVRSSWAFGINGDNFVKTMLRLGESRDELSVVGDQIGSPTYTADLAKLLCDMAATEKYGVYHATNEGFCSWAEFSREIFRQSGRHVTVRSISTDEYPTKAARPLNSRMSKTSLDVAGFSRLPDWQDGLERYLRSMGAYKA